jgi:hypothetical protein
MAVAGYCQSSASDVSVPDSSITARDTHTVAAVLMMTASHNGRNADRYAFVPACQRVMRTATITTPTAI